LYYCISEIPNIKSQITNKLQIQNSKPDNVLFKFCFGHWILFDI